MRSRIFSALAWFLLIAILGALGWVLIATSFMVYDDEGYVLISVRSFCEGHPLYSDVFSQYGPGFYLYYKLLHSLTGITYDHSTGRLLTLAYWVSSAAAIGALATRLTSSRIAGWASAALGFVTLAPNISEPFHPGSLLALISVLAALAGVEGVLRGSHRMGMALAALGAFALLIKINVGFFILCAWGGWWLLTLSAHKRWRAWTGWGVAAAVITAPLVLMRTHLDQGWAVGFAWIFMAGALAAWIQLTQARHQPADRFAWRWPAVVIAFITVVAVGMAAFGTPLSTLWRGAVVAPLSHPNIYTFPAGTSLWSGSLAWASFAALTWAVLQSDARRRTWLIVTLRVIGLALYFWQTKAPINKGPLVLFAFEWGPLLAGWMLLPLANATPRETVARAWLGWFFCWQILHAYPVAGSQVAWGGVLWSAVAIIGCVDLCRHFASRWQYANALGAVVASCAALVSLTVSALCARAWWHDSLALGLPGARWVRPVPEIARSIQVLDTNIRREAGLVFSLPGMFSFNLWSDRPTPSNANTTHWFSLLDDRRQAEIVNALASDPRSMLIVQRDLLAFLMAKDYKPSGLLAGYLRIAFVPTMRVGSYDLCVKRDRTVPSWDTFSIKGGSLVAWISNLDAPTALYLRNPGPPAAADIPLPSAIWTRLENNAWKIESPIPAGMPSQAGRMLVATASAGESMFMENTLPLK